MNQEFRKYFPTCDFIPIIRIAETRRYWINSNLIELKIDSKSINLSKCIIEIIEAYIESKQSAFASFIETCESLKKIENKNTHEIKEFILGLLAPNVDARIFEIVSYSILKVHYKEQSVYFGFSLDSIEEEL